MISRRIRVQLIAFVILACVGIVYTGGKYAGLARLFTATTYTVQMNVVDTGGIFTNAEVTYRGVSIGRVGDLHPTANGAVVDLQIDKGTPQIPSTGLHAEVKNLSVIGELYVDLTPSSTNAPYLHGGSVIPSSHTGAPVAPATLLASLNGFLQSVPAKQSGIVLDESAKAFGGGGQDLGQLLDSSSQLIQSAQESLQQTTALINDGSVVLRTQNATANSVKSFSHSLDLLSRTLKSVDPDLNTLIATAPLATTELSDLLRESGAGFSQVIADLLTTARVADPRGDALRELLITYPVLTQAASSALPGDGFAHFGLVVNAFDPPPCTRGYESTTRHAGSGTANVPVNKHATCAEPSSSPIDVRGTQNAPHHGIPAAVPYPSTAGYSSAATVSWGASSTWAQGPADILSGGH